MVNIAREMSSATSANAPPHRPIRADTLDLKEKLAVALGQNGARYWQTLVQFLKGAIDRSEFEALAHKALKAEHVHLHNALILGILYNASADVPGPSSRAVRRITRILPDGSTITEEEEEEPSRKRLRNLVAGLPRKERLRLKNLEKAGKLGANAVGGAAGLGWAGSAADMLEKKRKDEEKRKVAEDRRKVRQYKSAIGAKDWKGQSIQATQQIAAVRGKLSFSAQQAVARALQAPLCVESKHLPDLDAIKDRMTLLAVENGMPGGVQPQAAAMVLSALQSHLQNVASSIITKIRANRTDGIRTNEPLRPAAEYNNISLDPAAYMPDPMRTSPALDGMDLDESVPNSVQGSPTRHIRSIQSDMSSRTSTSGIGTSFADSSMLSLASTAATSLAGPASPSVRDGDSSGQLQDTSFGNSSSGAPFPEENGATGSVSNRLKRSRDAMENGDRSTAASTRLTVSDVAFLLEVAPHTVVEPMGQGTQERMLAPEWSDDLIFGSAEDDASRVYPASPERQLARAARLAATTHLSDATTGATADVPVRNRFVIDQSAPLRLLDRRTLAENEGRARPTKGGLSVPDTVLTDVNGRKKDTNMLLQSSNNAALIAGHNVHRHKDDIWDVVDPVALFGQLCE
ncbi:related to HFI1 - adaptor protein required for structural integrity of the SAGA complex [Ustilago trichophora]|uniref:Related to HFI1 - adaptor protein required for structural integrity of the SAGA complex n=1 Tax=Ustilago trichophora TaxID=86804 RepID=A0A5C3EBV7_9BASI|nr:related to HFI1 - adaptor protein required for structural integrity of the SAGA complex [Ustilago trichophora]